MINATLGTELAHRTRFVFRGSQGATLVGFSPVGHYWVTSKESGEKFLVIVTSDELQLYQSPWFEVNDANGVITVDSGHCWDHPIGRRGEAEIRRRIKRIDWDRAREARNKARARRLVERNGGEVQR